MSPRIELVLYNKTWKYYLVLKGWFFMIDQFRGKYYFLSNFYSSPVYYRGMTFQNAEAAFHS